MKFDAAHFESLSGIPLGKYTIELAKHGPSEEEILSYAIANGSNMDLGHLESILYLLSNILTTDALHFLAQYLDHPAGTARFIAIKTIIGLPTVDEYIMERIVNALRFHPDEIAVWELGGMLQKPATEKARQIALTYKS